MTKANVNSDFIIIIPARYGSTRFPGKPLAKIGGEEMIVRVCRIASQTGIRVVVATDDVRIYDCVVNVGYESVMTSSCHKSGTDRVMEAFSLLGKPSRVVINLQGDEPFLKAGQIEQLIRCHDLHPETEIATLCREFDKSLGFESLFDPNVVKVTKDTNGKAIYFSRSIIPYIRNEKWQKWLDMHTFLTHVGIYAFRADILERVTALPASQLELAESLEQLRWVENGFQIHVETTSAASFGIDTPEDLETAERRLHMQEGE